MADINGIADQIQGLTLLEASQLVKLLEEKLGVSAAAAGWGRADDPQRPLLSQIARRVGVRRAAAGWGLPETPQCTQEFRPTIVALACTLLMSVTPEP